MRPATTVLLTLVAIFLANSYFVRASQQEKSKHTSKQPDCSPSKDVSTLGLSAEPRQARPDAGKLALPAKWIEAFQWRFIGPANMGGRITAIAVYEKDRNIWWVATASGGLLKTTNNGFTLEHQFDREATVSIGNRLPYWPIRTIPSRA